MHLIERVREGMKVLSSGGKNLGKVVFVKLGDPDAETPSDLDLADPAFVGLMGEMFGSFHQVTPEVAEKLFRIGYLEVDPPGIGKDKYYAADEIAGVEGDTVRLYLA